ncbi:MAG: GldG family protein [Candidatus Riflebacteria bacterium]|nr:GldG family protein [Candidatus Riflebacteria bacterium]
MNDKRRIQIPVLPYLLLILALAVFIAAGLIHLNFPGKTTAAMGTLVAAAVLAIAAFAIRPAMVAEIFTSRKTILWLNDIVLVLLIIGIGVVLSHIGFRRNIRYDFTANKMFSLSEMTIKAVRGLEKDVRITAFFPQGTPEEQMIQDLLKEYRRHSEKFSFRMVDPMRDPVTARAMNISALGTVVVQCDASRQDIFSNNLFEVPNQYSPQDSKPKFTGEQALTSAIFNVTSGIKRMISFVKGHGEAVISGFQPRDLAGVNELLVRENFDVVETNLLENDIDARTSVVVISSPQQDFLEGEIIKLQSFLRERKGHLIVALDPGKRLEQLENFVFNETGVMFNNDIVVDPRGIGRNYWSVAPTLEDHLIVRPVKEKNMLGLMFHCRSLNIEKKDGFKVEPIMKSIDNSWAKRGLKENEQIDIAFEEGRDVRGPFNLGVAVENTAIASGSRALVYGDADFFSNAYIGSLANRDLFINGINWLVGQHQQISIRPRVLEMPRIVFDEKDAGKIFSLCVFGAPALIIILGVIVFMVRRRV